DEGGLGGARVAAGDGFLELAQEGADPRAARLVHFGAGRDLADRLLGAGVVGHQSNLTNGNAAEPGPRRGKSQERAAIAERGGGFKRKATARLIGNEPSQQAVGDRKESPCPNTRCRPTPRSSPPP